MIMPKSNPIALVLIPVVAPTAPSLIAKDVRFALTVDSFVRGRNLVLFEATLRVDRNTRSTN
jgi:hypothetical protein